MPFQDKVTLSDLAGQDPKTHADDPVKVIAAVRGVLFAKTLGDERTRGAAAIRNRYAQFDAALPRLAQRLEISEAEIGSFDYLRDWISIMTAWLRLKAV